MSPPLEQSGNILSIIYSLLEYTEEHEILNYKQKITSGMIKFATSLTEINFKEISQQKFDKMEESLKSIDELSLENENKTAFTIYKWLKDAIELHRAEKESKYQGKLLILVFCIL